MAEEHVERRARAAWIAKHKWYGHLVDGNWEHVSESEKRLFRVIAAATFAADRKAGYVLVPEKATEKMAAESYSGYPGDSRMQGHERLNAAIAAGAVKEEQK